MGLELFPEQPVRYFLRGSNTSRKPTILLTSHYMADIEALCRRVIIIDRGALFFDGQLSDVLDRFADFKLITIQCDADRSFPREGLEKFGEIIEHTAASVKLRVKRDR